MYNCRQSAGKLTNQSKDYSPSETIRRIKEIHISEISDENLTKYLKYFREELEWSILKIVRYLNKYNIKCSESSVRRGLIRLNITYKPRQKGSFYNRTHSDETRNKISKKAEGREGYWKGKTMSYEVRQKLSKSLLGRKLKSSTIEKKSKWMLENNPFRGRTHSKETKEWLSLLKIGTTLTESQKNNLSEKFKGCNNPNYKHGKFTGNFKGESRYSNKTYARLRKNLLTIFNNSCAECEGVDNLQLHHIIPVRELEKREIDFQDKYNLIPLCLKCHQPTLFKESEFEEYFKDIVRTAWRYAESDRNDHSPHIEE